MTDDLAAQTEVSSAKSCDEIERTLQRYGADQFMCGWQKNTAVIRFRMHGKEVAFLLPLPAKDDKQFSGQSLQMVEH